MDYIDRFRNRMKMSGSSLKGELTKNSRDLIENVFADDPSHENVFLWKLGLVKKEDYENETPINIRLYGRKYTTSDGMVVSFQTLMDNPIIVGDVVYVLSKDLFLLCIESFNINNTHYKGKFSYCNWILKWQDENGNILEYPCYDSNSTQYNSGEASNKQFTIGSSQHSLKLPCDENTCKLSSPKRFYLDKNIENPTSYILTQNDTTSYNFGEKGIVRLTLLESPNDSETDRPDLGICDYIKKEPVTEIDKSKYSKIEYKTKTIKSGGSYQKFYGLFFENETQINSVRCVWDVVYDGSNFLDIKMEDDCIQIGVDNDALVDDEFKLCLKDENNEYEPSYIIIKIGRLF